MSCIDISNVLTSGWTAAFHGMRNSRQSWAKSDSVFEEEMRNVIIGEKDLELASKLAKLGGSHAKFRRMIHVSMDISAPLYWWKEFDTYKIGTTTNSTSTMYSIANKEFELNDFAIDPDMYKLTDEDREKLLTGSLTREDFLEKARIVHPGVKEHWNATIDILNSLRNNYNDASTTAEKYQYWREIIQLLPESYKQLRTVDMNYEVVSHIAKERKGHKLREWGILILEFHKLPYAYELIFCDKSESSQK